jgi:hypothetical protein
MEKGLNAFLIAVVVMSVMAWRHSHNFGHDTATTADAATVISADTVQLNDKYPPQPSNEQAFVQAVAAARGEFNSGANDMAKGAARVHRAQALCHLLDPDERSVRLPGLKIPIEKWTGKVVTLSSNNDGKGVLGVTIGHDIMIKTWNNGLSDISDDTLIDPDSDVGKHAMTMSEGQWVTFSGGFVTDKNDCIQEKSLTQEGSMTKPEFIFQFSAVDKAS